MHDTPQQVGGRCRAVRSYLGYLGAAAVVLAAGRGGGGQVEGQPRLYQAGKIVVVPPGASGVAVGPMVTKSNRPARAATRARVWWDDRALTVTFKCADQRIVASGRKRDDADLWRDDCVEVFLDAGHRHNPDAHWYHVIVSAAGVVLDEAAPYVNGQGDASFDVAGLEAMSGRTEDGWSATIVIPWKGLGVKPKPGEVWGFNLNRTNHPEGEYLCFSPTWGGFHKIDDWGHLVFGARDWGSGDPELRKQIMAGPHRAIEERQKARMAAYLQKPPDRTPAWVNKAKSGLGRFVIASHRVEGPVWGLGKRDPSAKDWDEVGSCEYVQLLHQYDMTGVGGLTEKTRREAIRFWQGWQDRKSGRFHDPRDRARSVNEKYVVGVLRALGAKPLYAWSTSSTVAGEVHTDVFLLRSKEDPDWEGGGWGVGSHTGSMAIEIFDAINDKGREDLIRDLERGIENILSHQGGDGLWGPVDAPLAGRIGGTLKVIGRLYFRLGLEVPRTKELADSLIAFQMSGRFRDCSANSCIPRNTAEMLAYCIEASAYRRDDLRQAMWACLMDMKEFVKADGSISNDRGGKGGALSAITYSMGLAAAYLGWKDCVWPDPLASDARGRGYKYRVLLTDDGRVKVLKKESGPPEQSGK